MVLYFCSFHDVHFVKFNMRFADISLQTANIVFICEIIDKIAEFFKYLVSLDFNWVFGS